MDKIEVWLESEFALVANTLIDILQFVSQYQKNRQPFSSKLDFSWLMISSFLFFNQYV